MLYRHVVVGVPGSTHDAAIWAECDLATAPEHYFRPNEMLLADSAYPLSAHLVASYKEPELNSPERRRFNKTHHALRTRLIEDAFGLTKQLFEFVATRLRCKPHNASLYILAAFILHNRVVRTHAARSE